MTRGSRRRFLERVGAVGAAVLTVGCNARSSGTTQTTPSRTEPVIADIPSITREVVEPGGTFTRRVGSGETFENAVIDISAPGATFDIEATGSGWTVRNIGIRGVWDQYEKAEPFRVQVDEGGTGLVRNFYFADGCPDDTYAGVTGIYVYRHHAGRLRIDRVNIQDMPDNAIYASTCGRPADNRHGLPGGAGGAVEITNSYAADCQASHFRLGTEGSFARNCVAVGGAGGHRGFLGRFDHTRAIDCDFSGHVRGDVVCGTFEWQDAENATVMVVDSRYESTDLLPYSGRIVGDAGHDPRTEPPVGVPRSAEAAAWPSSPRSTGQIAENGG